MLDGVVCGDLFFVNTSKGRSFVMLQTNTETRWGRRTDESKQRFYAYLRDYRAKNPDKVRKWREAYILRKAQRLLAERGAGDLGGGADRGGD